MGCVFVRFGPADERTLCAASDTLMSWSASARRWTPSRTIAPNATLELRQASGARVVFSTGAVAEDTIGGRRMPVMLTRVSTFGDAGREVRRLDERYAEP